MDKGDDLILIAEDGGAVSSICEQITIHTGYIVEVITEVVRTGSRIEGPSLHTFISDFRINQSRISTRILNDVVKGAIIPECG